jgi:hypothetical protein
MRIHAHTRRHSQSRTHTNTRTTQPNSSLPSPKTSNLGVSPQLIAGCLAFDATILAPHMWRAYRPTDDQETLNQTLCALIQSQSRAQAETRKSLLTHILTLSYTLAHAYTSTTRRHNQSRMHTNTHAQHNTTAPCPPPRPQVRELPPTDRRALRSTPTILAPYMWRAYRPADDQETLNQTRCALSHAHAYTHTTRRHNQSRNATITRKTHHNSPLPSSKTSSSRASAN